MSIDKSSEQDESIPMTCDLDPQLRNKETAVRGGREIGEVRETVHFLMEQAQSETGHFWTRFNVFLTINTASFAGVAAWMSSERPPHLITVGILGSVAILFCLIWFWVTAVSRYYGERFLVDARRIAETHPIVRDEFYLSLGFKEQDRGDDLVAKSENPFFDCRRPRPLPFKLPGSANCMHGVIFLFIILWFGVLVVETKSKIVRPAPPNPNPSTNAMAAGVHQ